MNTFRLIGFSSLIVASMAFNGCGSSDSTDSTDLPNAIVEYSCESTQIFDGINITMKLGANGNLTCDDLYGYPELQFIDNVNEMVINQLISSSTVTSNTHGSGTTTINLQEGTETIKGTDPENGSVDCVNTYDVPTPLYIYDAEELQNIYLDDYQLISTTCPAWVNEDDDSEDDIYEGTYTENITITETSGTVSEISSYVSMQ